MTAQRLNTLFTAKHTWAKYAFNTDYKSYVILQYHIHKFCNGTVNRSLFQILLITFYPFCHCSCIMLLAVKYTTGTNS